MMLTQELLAPPTPDIASPEDVERFVRDFYRFAAMDDLLGPVFAAARIDWKSHIETLVDFWSWQLFGVRGYEGTPLRAHAPANARTPFTDAHYARWLDLFESTIDGLFCGPVADLAKSRGRKMASALARLLAGTSDAGSATTTVTFTTAGRG
jgi:hemoglobin